MLFNSFLTVFSHDVYKRNQSNVCFKVICDQDKKKQPFPNKVIDSGSVCEWEGVLRGWLAGITRILFCFFFF